MIQPSETARAIGYVLSVAVHEGKLPVTIDCEGIAVALDRARVVGVLDAYDDARATSHHRPTAAVRTFGGYATALVAGVFPTRDAARAAAAEAIETGKVKP